MKAPLIDQESELARVLSADLELSEARTNPVLNVTATVNADTLRFAFGRVEVGLKRCRLRTNLGGASAPVEKRWPQHPFEPSQAAQVVLRKEEQTTKQTNESLAAVIRTSGPSNSDNQTASEEYCMEEGQVIEASFEK